MVTIIKNDAIDESPFEVVCGDAIDLAESNQILPMATYLESLEQLRGRNDIGVWVDADEEVEALAGLLDLQVIALNFPAFNDGRAYSSANLLRRKLGFEGEIRAIGDVRRDQLEQMVRCGFDAFEMADGQDLDAALASLKVFSDTYQIAIGTPQPLFRRR
ncbi:MAG: DUF934 domain-containing protein [Proteobacteria bacterium]|jgi:uncharacterized protein (DUF934 family)|nr:DUF934 domain-containing protein [Pseudomonadota bacterium]MDA1300475.1 DUF934 domain-containing protein [Pseudomonadota bacterium]